MGQIRLMESPFSFVSIELNRGANTKQNFLGSKIGMLVEGRECRIWGHGKGSAESGRMMRVVPNPAHNEG